MQKPPPEWRREAFFSYHPGGNLVFPREWMKKPGKQDYRVARRLSRFLGCYPKENPPHRHKEQQPDTQHGPRCRLWHLHQGEGGVGEGVSSGVEEGKRLEKCYRNLPLLLRRRSRQRYRCYHIERKDLRHAKGKSCRVNTAVEWRATGEAVSLEELTLS